MDTGAVKIIVLVALNSYSTCTPTLTCNTVVELESSARLHCSLPGPTSVYFSTPSAIDIAYCLPIGECTSKDNNYVISRDITNTSITRLDIQRVQRSDEGDWTCRDAETNNESICTIVVTKSPSCDIYSDTDVKDLTVNQEISLTVNVTDYYCSLPVHLLLEVGSATAILTDSHRVTAKTSDRFTVVFKVTEAHFGPVELHLVCNNIKRPVRCGGIGSLPKSMANSESPAAKSAMVAGITIPVVIIISVVGLIVCFLRRKRKKRPAGSLVQSDA